MITGHVFIATSLDGFGTSGLMARGVGMRLFSLSQSTERPDRN